ncbi:MAG: hypothetical protein R2849_18625 [Thermomicrobiales bacterium]
MLTSDGSPSNQDVNRADQREPLLEGQDENDPAIVILEDVSAAIFEELRDNDVASLDQSRAIGGVDLQNLTGDALCPGTSRVHHESCSNAIRLTVLHVRQLDLPDVTVPTCAGTCGPRADFRCAILCVDGRENDEPGVIGQQSEYSNPRSNDGFSSVALSPLWKSRR